LPIIQWVFILFFPFLLIKFVQKKQRAAIMSPILLCYLAGVTLANIPSIPLNPSISMLIAKIAVPLAIPLILFSSDFMNCLRLAKRTLLSFGLIVISVLLSSSIGSYVFASRVHEYWQVAGMLVGVYTGGTPNLMAVGMGLNVTEQTIILVNTADVLMGSLYILFLILLAKPILASFLPPFQSQNQSSTPNNFNHISPAEPLITEQKTTIKKLILAAGLSTLIVGVSYLISLLVIGQFELDFIILIITTLGIAGSFIKSVREIEGTFEAGEYLLLVFSLAIGTTINFHYMAISNYYIFYYVAFVLTGTVLLHFFLSYLFRIDVDTTIIVSTAGIFGPPFIPPVATSIKNKELIVTGITISLLGIALGNYLGFFLAYLLAP